VREALEEAIRRGPPSRFEVAATTEAPGTLRLVIRDDAPTERRRRALEVLGERARTLGANLTLDHDIGGTTMSLELRGQPTDDD
jgi:nitrate/nitrite-specific signal transduction histidine kinase